MNADDRSDDEVRDAYRQPMAGEDQARDRAIAHLRREIARGTRVNGGWWMDPDALRIQPLLAVASLIAVLAIGAFGGAWWAASRGTPPGIRGAGSDASAARAASGELQAVTFVFRAPGATRVCLVGDFNDWDPDA